MAQATIKTRIQLKCDTEENWNKAINFIPLKGEVIIYSADDTHPFSRLKVGDGETNVMLLPFVDSNTTNGKSINVGTTAEWNSRINYIPKLGDIILYTDKAILEDDTLVAGIKIGDGSAYCVDLPFVGDEIIEDLFAHTTNMNIHITDAERIKWNNKINCNDTIINENLILTKN